MHVRVPELMRARAQTLEKLNGFKRSYNEIVKREGELADGESLPEEDRTRIDELTDSIATHEEQLREHDARITRAETALGYEADTAEPVEGEERGGSPGVRRSGEQRSEARERKLDHEKEPTLVIGGICRMIAAAHAFGITARDAAIEILGDRHPVTEVLHGKRGWGADAQTNRSLMASAGPAGGFLLPPDYVAEMIELLRAQTVVRSSNPRVINMPRGTMQMPRQNQAAIASYGGETTPIPVSQQSVGQIVATYKKLTAMTPITNDLLRYSDPGVDAIVRDDLTQVIARREDLAFLRGDGSQDSPKGFASFCLPGQKLVSTAAYQLSTVSQELGGALNKIETANVPLTDLVWIMHPRSKNYLLSVQNSNGFYVYREEMTTSKTLLGVPYKTTTQIPVNLTVGGNSDCSEITLVSMSQAMLFDAMRFELAVSREGTYTDASGNLVSTFQTDQTLIRAIAEHDFHMRHDEAIAMILGVRWAPAIS